MTSILKEDWSSRWRPVRNVLLTIIGVIGYSVPGFLVIQKSFDMAPGDALFASPIFMIGIILISISISVFLPLLKKDMSEIY